MPLRSGYLITIYVPLADSDSVEQALDEQNNEILRKVIESIHEADGIGRMGKYDNVFTTTLGKMFFTPLSGAKPAESSPKWVITVTTYAFDLDISQLESFFEKLTKIIQWEHPVFECLGPQDVKVWMPTQQTERGDTRQRM